MLTKQILENEVETTMTQSQSAIALLMWGDDFEDFYGSLVDRVISFSNHQKLLTTLI